MRKKAMDGEHLGKKEDWDMAVFARPSNMTFKISKNKFDQFKNKDTKSAFKDTIKRFELHNRKEEK